MHFGCTLQGGVTASSSRRTKIDFPYRRGGTACHLPVAGAVAASDLTGQRLEDLQYLLGEGPSVDATGGDGDVFAADLRAETARWPSVAPEAAALGVDAAFGFPLQVSRRAGVLPFYRAAPGQLDSSRLAGTRRFARVVTAVLLSRPVDLEDGLATPISRAAFIRDLVNQAAGIATVAAGCGTDDALARLRPMPVGRDDRPGPWPMPCSITG